MQHVPLNGLDPQQDDVLTKYMADDLPEFSGHEYVAVETIGNFGNYPINVAATRGIISEISWLVSNGANIDSKGELGNTPLHDAAGQGHCDAVRFLLELGADSKIRNDFDLAPVDVAKLMNHIEVVDLLRNDQKMNRLEE